MILLLDTSTPTCRVQLKHGSDITAYEWEANRTLADGLIGYVRAKLNELNATWDDITGIGVYKGPGSFTGLRIGLTVMNTLASDKMLPIVGETGETWQQNAITRLENGETDTIVMPLYGREANITKQRK